MEAPKIVADHQPTVKEIHVVWMTTGLGCDGDSVSVTAATLPSIEDVVMGAIPGLPKVHLHNPVLAYEVGDDFMKYWHAAAEGSWIRSCSCSKARCRTKRSRRKATGPRWAPIQRPASRSPPTNGSIGLRPKRLAVICRRHLRDLRRHSRHGRQSHRRDGPGRLSRLELALESRACRSSMCPVVRCSPTT